MIYSKDLLFSCSMHGGFLQLLIVLTVVMRLSSSLLELIESLASLSLYPHPQPHTRTHTHTFLVSLQNSGSRLS